MIGRLAIGILLAGLAAAVAVGVAGAERRAGGSDLHDARYCEVLELRGAIPDASVTVWNTIGLNGCPAAKWEAIDAGALAAARGAEAVVLNGPRHFLMDSATATIGRRQTLGGIEMRRVATIPIRTAADLTRSTYTERTVKRRNTWTWERGRRVYELLAPDGSDYVMQSYAQIRDPSQTIGDLRSLGSRLELPKGWAFRTKRLRRDLTLRAGGEATIVQDELQNTYQRLPRKARSKHLVAVAGVTRAVDSPAPGTSHDAGTISGEPFGDGTVDILVTFGPESSVTGSFDLVTPRGSAFGTVAMTYVIAGSEITFTGTATFSGGTGDFRGIKGTVDAFDHNTLDGQNGSVRLDGFARY